MDRDTMRAKVAEVAVRLLFEGRERQVERHLSRSDIKHIVSASLIAYDKCGADLTSERDELIEILRALVDRHAHADYAMTPDVRAEWGAASAAVAKAKGGSSVR